MFGKNKGPKIFEGHIKKIGKYISVLKVGDGVNYGLEPKEILMSSVEMDNGCIYNTESNLFDYKEGDNVLFYFSANKKIEKNIVILDKSYLSGFKKIVKQEKNVLRWLRLFCFFSTLIMLYIPFKQVLDSGFQSALNDDTYRVIILFLFVNLKLRFFFLPKNKIIKHKGFIEAFIKKEEDQKLNCQDIQKIKDDICQKVG